MADVNDSNELIAADGTRAGDRIPGSKYVRAFCECCGEPMRVPTEKIVSFCNVCKDNIFGKTIKYTIEELWDEGLEFHFFDDRNFFDD
jgi:hypothetical protein